MLTEWVSDLYQGNDVQVSVQTQDRSSDILTTIIEATNEFTHKVRGLSCVTNDEFDKN